MWTARTRWAFNRGPPQTWAPATAHRSPASPRRSVPTCATWQTALTGPAYRSTAAWCRVRHVPWWCRPPLISEARPCDRNSTMARLRPLNQPDAPHASRIRGPAPPGSRAVRDPAHFHGRHGNERAFLAGAPAIAGRIARRPGVCGHCRVCGSHAGRGAHQHVLGQGGGPLRAQAHDGPGAPGPRSHPTGPGLHAGCLDDPGAALRCALCAAAVAVRRPRRPAAGSALGGTELPSLPPLSGNAAPLQPPSWFESPVAGLLAVLGILLVARMLTQTPFAMYGRSVFAVDNWVVGLCYGLLSMGFIVSATLWARYFERLQGPGALVSMAWVAAACALLTVLAGATHSVAFFIALHFAWGVLLGATPPVLMAQISHATSGQHQGRILGVAQSTAQFSSMAGIALGGGLTQLLGLHTTYFLVAGAYACALAVIVAVLRMRRTRPGAAGLSGP